MVGGTTEQLAEARADVVSLPEALKAWGSWRTLPAEIERLNAAIAELGAVNLAALDELAQATERKEYLDRQAADIAAFRRDESLTLPEGLDYAGVKGLSNEARQKLSAIRPQTIGQAGRIDGMTPAARTRSGTYKTISW